jgi:hypothetical protein
MPLPFGLTKRSVSVFQTTRSSQRFFLRKLSGSNPITERIGQVIFQDAPLKASANDDSNVRTLVSRIETFLSSAEFRDFQSPIRLLPKGLKFLRRLKV